MDAYKNYFKKSYLVFLATILFIFQSGILAIPTASANTLQDAVTITALDENGEVILETQAVSIEDGQTAMDALEKVTEVEKEESEYGAYLTEINHYRSPDGYYWSFFINGTSAETGADSYTLSHGENILFKVVNVDEYPSKSVNVSVTAKDLNGESIINRTEIQIVEDATAYDALVKAAEKNSVDLDDSVHVEWLTYITNLNNELDDSAYWGTYINNAFMDTGLVRYKMKEGDHLELKAEKIDFGNNEQEEGKETVIPNEENELEDNSSPSNSKDIKENPVTNENTDHQSNHSSVDISQLIEELYHYLQSKNNVDWYGFITLNKLNKEVNKTIGENAFESVKSNHGDFRNVTDLAKNILILTAAGYDATNIDGIDLIDKLTKHERMTSQGNNGIIYSLLAIHSGGYETKEGEWTRDKLVEYLLDQQLENGGWSLFGSQASVDLTGMALTVLAPLKDREDVHAAIDEAVNYLSTIQADEGGYPDPWHGGDTAESIAMAITGLASVGVDPTSDAFTKDVHLIERLLQFNNDDGGFKHNIKDKNSSGFPSNQALLGLAAYYYFLNNEGSVFEFNNATEEVEDLQVKIEKAIERAVNYILENGVESEWQVIGLVQTGKDIPESYLEYFKQNIDSQIIAALDNGRIKITDIERLAMAAVALGMDPQNINIDDISGLNLMELIYNSPERRGGYDTMIFQGNNGPIFALIALDTMDFEVPEDAKWTRQKLIDELLRTQNDDGSWALNEAFGIPSIDVTGMALIGLSPYKDQVKVKAALDRAVDWLAAQQTDGGFDGGAFVGGINSEAASQVIIGLSAYGIDSAGEKFTQNGISLIEHLLDYQNPDGGFKHTMEYDWSDGMATEQALQALVAYDYFLKGKGSLYDFVDETDNEDPPVQEEDEEVENPPANEEEKDEEVEDPPVHEDEDKEGKDPPTKGDSQGQYDDSSVSVDNEKSSGKENETKGHPVFQVSKEELQNAHENSTFVKDLQNAKEVNSVTVEIDPNTLDFLIENNMNLEINKVEVSIMIPSKLLKQWKELGDGTVTIQLDKLTENNAIGAVYDLTIKVGDKIISDFNGNEIILCFQVDKEVASDVKTDNIKLFFYNENIDEWEVIKNSNYDPNAGLVTANTTHFSIFGVFEIEESDYGEIEEKINEENEVHGTMTVETDNTNKQDGEKLPSTATNLYNYILFGALLLAMGGALFFVRKLRV